MDREARQVTLHRVTESDMAKQLSTHTYGIYIHMCAYIHLHAYVLALILPIARNPCFLPQRL